METRKHIWRESEDPQQPPYCVVCGLQSSMLDLPRDCPGPVNKK